MITPSLNQGDFLDQAIRSVLGQDYPSVEHIVVDGGSTDGTMEILKRYPRVQWISEPDRGQSDALNKGFALATGEIFGWLNADDLYLPGAITTAVELLAQGGAGLVYGGWEQINELGKVIRTVPARPFVYADLLDGRNLIAQPAAFFTREALERVGGIDTRYHYAMDFDLWLRISQRFPVARVDATLAAFRLHPSSKSVADADRFWPETRRISRRHGGAFFSQAYVDRLADTRPALFRLLMAFRMLRARNFKGLARRVRSLLPGRSKA